MQHRPHIPALTSLRFFAALSIVVLHATNHGLLPAVWAERVDLSMGVSFFFVLSGFVLGYAYSGRCYSVRGFYKARFARVWPAAAFSILLVPILLPAGFFLPQPGGWAIAPTMLIALFGLQSLVPIPEVFFGLNAVTWSISTEACFYVLFPWLQRWVRLRPIGLLIVIMVLGLILGALALQLPGLGPSSFSTPVWQGLVYVNPIARLGEFVSGLLAAELFLGSFIQLWLAKIQVEQLSAKRWLFTCCECLAIATPFVIPKLLLDNDLITHLALPAPIEILLTQWICGICFAFVVTVFALQLGILSKLLSWAPLIFLGEISYGLYLYHQILMIRLVQAPQILIGSWIIPRPNFLQILLISLFLAFLSNFYLERPCAKALCPRSV